MHVTRSSIASGHEFRLAVLRFSSVNQAVFATPLSSVADNNKTAILAIWKKNGRP